MPKIKSIETVEDSAQSAIVQEQKVEEDNAQSVIVQEQKVEDSGAVTNITTPPASTGIKPKDVKVSSKPTNITLPKVIDDALKNFRQYQELYVNGHGGVFTSDTKPELRESAILYQNPYYNN